MTEPTINDRVMAAIAEATAKLEQGKQRLGPPTGPTTTRNAVLHDLATVDALVAENPETMTVSMLRWQLRHRQENGLNVACVRVGKRLLISRTRYDAWLASQIGA